MCLKLIVLVPWRETISNTYLAEWKMSDFDEFLSKVFQSAGINSAWHKTLTSIFWCAYSIAHCFSLRKNNNNKDQKHCLAYIYYCLLIEINELLHVRVLIHHVLHVIQGYFITFIKQCTGTTVLTKRMCHCKFHYLI